MKYSYLCEHCKRKDNCKGYVEKTTSYVQVFFCPKFIHNDGKQMTNADRIRAMNDEELAKNRIDRIDMYTKSDFKEYIGDFNGIEFSEEEAIKKELEWLQSEAE